MPTNYNFTENNTLISFDEAFIRAEQFRNTSYLWGLNNSYQLGDNTTAYRSTPRQEFTSSTNWKQVQGNYFNTAAIKTDGTLWVWGDNLYGQIGDNTTTDRRTPRQEFTSSTNWKQVTCGNVHTAAIKTDGTLWVWGSNSNGQIGDNTTASRSTPRQEFTSSTNWKQVSGGGYHTAAIKNNGTLWVWGFNLYGQLGDNTNESRSTPRQEFTSSTNWIQTSCGGANTVSIEAPPFNE